MNKIKRTACLYIMSMTLLCQPVFLCGQDYYTAIQSASSRITGWFNNNKIVGALAVSGVALSCYYLYQKYKNRPQDHSSSAVSLQLPAPEKTIIGNLSIYQFNGDESDIEAIKEEAEKDENFQWLAPDGRVQPGKGFSVYDIERVLRYHANDPNWIIHVIRTNNENQDFVGFILFNKKGYIELFLVKDTFRGQGYAKTIINNAFDTIRQFGSVRATLHTKTRNSIARRFYENLGFILDWDNGALTYYTKQLS